MVAILVASIWFGRRGNLRWHIRRHSMRVSYLEADLTDNTRKDDAMTEKMPSEIWAWKFGSGLTFCKTWGQAEPGPSSIPLEKARYALCPPGYRVVKEELTNKMLTDVGYMDGYDFESGSSDKDHVSWWKAMLVASPKPGEE